MNKCGLSLKAVERITAIAVILVFLCPAFAAADGMAFRYGPASSLEPLNVNEQRAVIAHKDGVQRMFIAINLENPSSAEPSQAAVWIFPVPGSPDKADVEVTAFMPELTGRDVQQEFDEVMEMARWTPLVTQPHFVPLAFFARFAGAPMGFPVGRMGRFKGAEGVTTHKEIDRWGIHAELITADSVDRLADYLRKKNVPVAEERLSTFASYLSDKYSLVVGWISSHEEVTKHFSQHGEKPKAMRPSLYVEFPTDKPFYPMRPTSGYGKNEMEVSLYMVGWVAPDMSSWTDSDKKSMGLRVRHYAGNKEAIHNSYRSVLSARKKDRTTPPSQDVARGQRKAAERFFPAIPEGEVHFTRVRIHGPAENFTQDLRFSPNPSVGIKHFIASTPWVLAGPVILLILGLSYVGGGISGKLVFGEWRPWAKIGLWNCFTIVALVIATWLRRRNLPAEAKQTAMSGRWEAFVLGAIIAVPLIQSVMIFLPDPDNRYYSPGELLFLSWGVVAVEFLAAAWIAATTGPSRPAETEPDPELEIPCHNRVESMIRVSLMCLPTVAILVMPNSYSMLGVPPHDVSLLDGAVRIPRSGVIIAGALSLLSGLIIMAKFMASWIFRAALTACKARRISNSNDIDFSRPRHKPEMLILGILTCITAFLVIVSSLDTSQEHLVSFFRSAWFGVIMVEFLIAGMLWKRASTPVPSKPRVSPAWPAAIAILLPICTLILCLVHYSDGPLKWALAAVLPLTVIGFVCIVPLRRVFRDMTDKRALAIVVVVLGVLSYLVVLLQVATAILRIGAARDSFAALALILATWIVKRALKEPPTKALRFGVVFSVVFAILTVTASFGLKYLFG